jgi:hypothetical protein
MNCQNLDPYKETRQTPNNGMKLLRTIDGKTRMDRSIIEI